MKDLKIKYLTTDSETKLYASQLEEYIKRDIPTAIVNNNEIANALLDLFIGSRNIRQGPQPNIEQKASMLKVIKYYISMNRPIPILIPTGPKKTINGEGVDLAELNVLKHLSCLRDKSVELYTPGFNYDFRIEDLTGIMLEGEEAKLSMESYIEQFHKLMSILNMVDYTSSFSEVTQITEISDILTYKGTVDYYTKRLYEYLLESDDIEEALWTNLCVYRDLNDAGWYGIIPKVMREHYYVKYNKLFPNNSKAENTHELAKYFACALARKMYNITGHHLYSNGALEIGYALPTPGYIDVPTSTRVYYRSIPLKQSKHNIPYWRAKGVYKISESSVKCSLISWTNLDEDIHIGNIKFDKDEEILSIKADSIFV